MGVSDLQLKKVYLLTRNFTFIGVHLLKSSKINLYNDTFHLNDVYFT